MMTDGKEQKPDQDFPDSSDNVNFSAIENINDSEGNKKQTESSADKDEAKKDVPQPSTVIVNIPKEDNTEAVKANKISLAGMIVNVLLFLITLAALWLTRDSVNISKDALQDSRKKDAEAVVRERTIDSLNSIIRGRDYVRDTTNIALSKQSLDAQINSIKETQKQFQIESRPVIQLFNFEVDSSNISEKTVVTFFISNLGKFPARIVSQKNKIIIGGNLSVKEIEAINYTDADKTIGVNTSISANSIIHGTATGIGMPKNIFEHYKKGEIFIYISGECVYKNFVTNNSFKLSYIFKLGYLPTFAVIGLKNIDTPI